MKDYRILTKSRRLNWLTSQPVGREPDGRQGAYGLAKASLLLALSLLAGCSKDEALITSGPRPVKVFEVGVDAAGAARVTGSVRARESASLAFQIPGRIASLTAEVGDTVQRGQVIATLDSATYALRLAQARAEVARASATLTEAQSRLTRHEQLLQRNFVAAISVDSIRGEVSAAKGVVDAGRAAEELAQRDVMQATLTAPFTGQVTRRLAEPFNEVTAGVPVIEMDADAGLEVVAPIPASLTAAFSPGANTKVLVRESEHAGRVERVSPRAGEAGTVDVVVRLADSHPIDIRAGDTVELIGQLPRDKSGFDVPFSALLLSQVASQGAVFVVQDGRANRREVTYAAATGGSVRVTSGLSATDVIVAAGARFLRDDELVTPQKSRVN